MKRRIQHTYERHQDLISLVLWSLTVVLLFGGFACVVLGTVLSALALGYPYSIVLIGVGAILLGSVAVTYLEDQQ